MGSWGTPGSRRRRQRIVERGHRPRPPVSGAWPRACVSQNRWRGQLIGDRAASRRPRLFGEKQGRMELSPSAGGQGWASLWPSQPLPRQAPSSVRSACVCLFLNAIPCQAALIPHSRSSPSHFSHCKFPKCGESAVGAFASDTHSGSAHTVSAGKNNC